MRELKVQDATILYIIETIPVADGLSLRSEMAQVRSGWPGRLIYNAVTAVKVIFVPDQDIVTPSYTFSRDVDSFYDPPFSNRFH